MRPPDPTFVSVIVPVYRDWTALHRCLTALEGQTYRSEGYEVIVVDNDGDLSSGAELDLERYSHVRVVREPSPGSYRARNRGILEARGAILAFTDADCVPHPDWLERAVAILQSSPEVSRLAGAIELDFDPARRGSPVELYERLFAFRQDAAVERYGAAIGANMIVRRSVFDGVGGFDERLYSGGDMEWGGRADRAGFPIVFAPGVRVSHPARVTWSRQIRKTRRIQGGLRVSHRADHEGPHRFQRLREVLSTPRLTLWGRARVLVVLIILGLVRMLEATRLRLGGRPVRT